MIRDTACDLCPLSKGLTQSAVCNIFTGNRDASILVVTKNPLGKQAQEELIDYLEEAGFDTEDLAVTAAIKCRNFDKDARKSDIKTCADEYLTEEIALIKPRWILALGNEALTATTGRAQVTKYRTKLFDHSSGAQVFPTISPSAVKRNPGQRSSFEADLRLLYRMTQGDDFTQFEPKFFKYVMDVAGLKEMIEDLKTSGGYAFDLETNGFNEYESKSKIISMSVTTWDEGATAPQRVWVIPLYHPESPFRKVWKEVLKKLDPYMAMPRKRVGHNMKFDLRWLNEFGVNIDGTFDTMLAAHVLNENRPKGLKSLAQTLLGVPAWDVDTKHLLDDPLEPTLRYNGLDTWYTAHLYFIFLEQLKAQPRLYALMSRLLMPASNAFTDIERQGIWVDRERLVTNAKIAEDTLQDFNDRLMEFVPDQSVWKEGLKAVNFNPSNFSRWLLFEYLEFPVLERGKQKEDGSPGNPSMAEGVMQKLQKYHPHPIIDLLLDRVKWQKYHSAFFSAYLEQIDENDRIHTTFKLTGTVTGRLSSGKGDDDKVTGRVQNRGVNLQQVPRDPFVKGIFGGGPGNVFLECDYSQIELRVAAFIARESTMIRLYQNEQDIHTATAMQMTGKPASQITAEERKKAKPVNFGFLYGMSAGTFVDTAWNNYGVEVTEDESIAFRKAFFTQFPDLLKWHQRQRQLAKKYKRVESPIGRVRHLPDIMSEDRAVRNEAERQAINCVTEDTEILTAQGWKVVDDLQLGELILSPNPDTGYLELQPLEKINRGIHSGKAWQSDHNSVSALTTPNHRWLVTQDGRSQFLTADKFRKSGASKIWVASEGLPQEETSWTDDEVELMGWVLTDGHYKKYGSKITRRLGVTQSKPRYLEELKDLFNRLGKHSYRVRPTGQHIWEITSDSGARIIREMPEKTLTPEVLLSMSHDQRKLLFLTMCKGDGSWNEKLGRFRRFAAGSEERANMFLMLCSLIGQPARSFTRDQRGKQHYSPKLPNKGHFINGTLTWHVELVKNKRAQSQYKSKWVEVEDVPMWCPTVENGAWVAKRKNRVFITGNSPVQSLASDMAIGALVTLTREFKRRGLRSRSVGTVHDAINFEVPIEELEEVAPLIKHHMENVPFKRWFGLELDVPIVGDIALSESWGEKEEIDPGVVVDPRRWRKWLKGAGYV